MDNQNQISLKDNWICAQAVNNNAWLFYAVWFHKCCAAGLTSDTRQARGPVRDAGKCSTDVSQNTVDVIFHPNWPASISHSRSGREKGYRLYSWCLSTSGNVLIISILRKRYEVNISRFLIMLPKNGSVQRHSFWWIKIQDKPFNLTNDSGRWCW